MGAMPSLNLLLLADREGGHCAALPQAGPLTSVPCVIISFYLQMWVGKVSGCAAHTNLGHKDKPPLDSLRGNDRDCQKLLPALFST